MAYRRKQITNLTNLNTHLVIHNGEKKHNCSVVINDSHKMDLYVFPMWLPITTDVEVHPRIKVFISDDTYGKLSP